jgi:hypothetical protein
MDVPAAYEAAKATNKNAHRRVVLALTKILLWRAPLPDTFLFSKNRAKLAEIRLFCCYFSAAVAATVAESVRGF